MLTITVDSITTSPSALSLGCVVRWPDGGPVQFAIATLPVDVLTRAIRRDLMDLFNLLEADFFESDESDSIQEAFDLT